VGGLLLASRVADLDAATGVVDGDVHGVVLTGPAGIGKTRVARDAMRLLVGREVPVAWVQGTEMARRIPFGAMAPYLPAIDHTADVLPILITATRALRELGGGRTVVVIVDDAPLLDDASALLLAQSFTAADARLVVTQRAGDPLPDALARLGLPRRSARRRPAVGADTSSAGSAERWQPAVPPRGRAGRPRGERLAAEP
jgi:hypothetical protein